MRGKRFETVFPAFQWRMTVAVKVFANDLKHFGTDTLADNHYHNVQGDCIIVTTQTYDERSNDGVVRRSLVANAAEVEEIIPGVNNTNSIRRSLQFAAARAEGRSWESITVQFVDTDALLGDT